MTENTKATKILDNTNFDTTIKSGISIVDFWAEWCGPCKVQGPIIDELAGEVGDNYNICKLDTDKNGELAQKYEITSIPSIILFKDGEVIEKLVGVQTKETLLSLLKSA